MQHHKFPNFKNAAVKGVLNPVLVSSRKFSLLNHFQNISMCQKYIFMLRPLTKYIKCDYKIIVRFTNIALLEGMPTFKPVTGLVHGHLKPPSMNVRCLYKTEGSAISIVPVCWLAKCKFEHVHHV
jgi:hypothetical protein